MTWQRCWKPAAKGGQGAQPILGGSDKFAEVEGKTTAAIKAVMFAGDVDEVRRNRRSFNGGTSTLRGTVD